MSSSFLPSISPFADSNVRRRGATYGKGARRQISGCGLDTISANASLQEENAWIRRDLPEHRPRATKSPIQNPEHSIDLATESKNDPGIRQSKLSGKTPEQSSPVAGINQVNSCQMLSYQVQSVPGLFDVPSSSDEDLSQNCLPVRKRRKATHKVGVDSTETMHRHNSMQRLATLGSRNSAELSSSLQRNLETQASRHLSPKKTDKISSSRSVTNVEKPSRVVNASVGPNLIPKHEKTNHQTIKTSNPKDLGKIGHPSRDDNLRDLSKMQKARAGKPLPDRAFKAQAKGATVSAHSLTPASPPDVIIATCMKISRPRTPSPPTNCYPVTFTSPRQRDLWNLLHENIQESSPSQLALPGLSLAASRSPTQRSQIYLSMGNGEPVRSVPKQPRRRLVDILQEHSDGEARHESVRLDGSDEGDESDGHSEDLLTDASKSRKSSPAETSCTSESQAAGPALQNDVNPTLPQSLISGGGPKVTYARQRSYLTGNDVDDAMLLNTSISSVSDSTQNDRRGTLKAVAPLVKNMPKSDEDPDENDGSQGIKNVHELRQAGGNVRIAGEIEALLDDIGEQLSVKIGVKRRALYDLLMKLQDPAFCRRFIDDGLEDRLVAQASTCDDTISRISFSMAMLYILARKKSGDLRSPERNLRMVGFLSKLLDFNQDIATIVKDRRNNMSKLAQIEYAEHLQALLQSPIWSGMKPSKVTVRAVSLQCLDYVVRQAREGGDFSGLLSQAAFTRLVDLFPAYPPKSRSTSFIGQAFDVHLATSILESCTIASAVNCDEMSWNYKSIQKLKNLLPSVDMWTEDVSGPLRTLALRLYLNVTNNNPVLCKSFSQPEVIKVMTRIIVTNLRIISEELVLNMNKHVLSLDNVILSLGCLINLVEWNSDARELFRITRDGQDSLLEAFIQLFLKRLQKTTEAYSEEETTLNVAFGYLSVLLSNLCVNDLIREGVRDRLHGGNLKQLIDAVEEFLHYHKKVEEQIGNQGDGDTQASFVGRLQNVVDRLKQIDGRS